MQRRKNIPAFIRNTYEMLQRQEFKDVVCWCEGGNGFVIKNLQHFSQIVLPQYFKHKKYTSFVRQLNMYGFHKQRHKNDYHYYGHQYFKKGILETTDNNLFLATLKRKPEKKKKISNQKLQADKHEGSQINPQNNPENDSSVKQSVSLQVDSEEKENKFQLDQQQAYKYEKQMKKEDPDRNISEDSYGPTSKRNEQIEEPHLNYQQQEQQQSNKSKQTSKMAEIILHQNIILRKMHTLIRETVLKCRQHTINKLEGNTINIDQPIDYTNRLTNSMNEQITQLQNLIQGFGQSD